MNKIQENITKHNKIYQQYSNRHSEIYNHREQERLSRALDAAKKGIRTKSKRLNALDYGCGDGNLTQHLIKLGFKVTAADVTPGFLSLIEQNFSSSLCNTTLINGTDLNKIQDNSYDLVATYSVLHHVPDYLAIIEEFCRVLKPGGILYLDHERSDNFWNPNVELRILHKLLELKENQKVILGKDNFFQQLSQETKHRTNLLQLLRVQKRKYVLRKNPRYQEEGDIHVFPDDHIEWSKIKSMLKRKKYNLVFEDKFLLFDSKLYTPEEYQVFSKICNDEVCYVTQKPIKL
jgi:2-polyprenyl-3-methyl-5-hydroxy-6-metoxy-1,4-benzoquinol methylase